MNQYPFRLVYYLFVFPDIEIAWVMLENRPKHNIRPHQMEGTLFYLTNWPNSCTDTDIVFVYR